MTVAADGDRFASGDIVTNLPTDLVARQLADFMAALEVGRLVEYDEVERHLSLDFRGQRNRAAVDQAEVLAARTGVYFERDPRGNGFRRVTADDLGRFYRDRDQVVSGASRMIRRVKTRYGGMSVENRRDVDQSVITASKLADSLRRKRAIEPERGSE